MERKTLIEEALALTIELKYNIMTQPANWLILWLINNWLAFLID